MTLRVIDFNPQKQKVKTHMNRHEIKHVIETEINNGTAPILAITNLLLKLGLDPVDPILWYQQTIGGE